jgi:hypothetical protein
MEYNLTVIAGFVSAPLCIVFFFNGLIRFKRAPGSVGTVKGTLPGGSSIEIDGNEIPQRRELDRTDGRQALVADIVAALGEKLDHKCSQVEVIRGLTEQVDAVSETTFALANYAVDVDNRNGEIKSGRLRMAAALKDWDKLKTDRLTAGGVRS